VTGTGVAATDVANIQNAVKSCSDRQVVLLNGTFVIKARVNLYGHSITVRGNGPQSTILNFTGNGELFMGATAPAGSGSLTASPAAGATSVTINSTSAPPSGQIAYLTQCDTGSSGNPCSGTLADNGGLYVCGTSSVCAGQAAGGEPRDQAQTIRITSVVNNGGNSYTVNFVSSLGMPNWNTSQTPILSWNTTMYNGVGVGIEDLSIVQNSVTPSSYSSSGIQTLIEMSNNYGSWVKGVRFIGSAQSVALKPTNSKNCLIANNYFYYNPTLSHDYGPAMQTGGVSDSLILNNLSALGMLWEGFGGNSGNVFAYNYVTSMFTDYVENAFFDHHPYDDYELFEGNQTGVMHEDDTWGTADLNTYFRNYIECWDPPYTSYVMGANSRAMVISDFHRFINVIGNAIGSPTWCTGYQGSGYTNVFQIDTPKGDSLVASTLMRWGNVSVVTQSSDTPASSGIRFVNSEVPTNLSGLPTPVDFSNSVPATTNLPASFFMNGISAHPSGGTGLSWWKVCDSWTTFPTSCAHTTTQPFPTAGPDVTSRNQASSIDSTAHVNNHAWDIPAAIAYRTLPPDPAFQNSYTVGSSSWSNGTETLSGISPAFPDSEHIQGGFQLTGVNAACVGGASELFITASSTTSVSYALASNPSVSCTGTVKFPDVRQFDERVYQNDLSGGGGGNPVPPTALSVTVQ
jgi:hypothetical protein